MPKVFISHSTKDRKFVEVELVPLLNHHEIETWFSVDDIKTAEHWENAIQDNLRSCDWFLIVLSPDAISSQWVRAETGWALEEKSGKVIPVLYRTCTPYALNLKLRLIQHLDYRKDRESARKRLLAVWGVPYDPTAQSLLFRTRRSTSWFKIAVAFTLSLLVVGVAASLWFYTSSQRAKHRLTNTSSEPTVPTHVDQMAAPISMDRQLAALNQSLSSLHQVVGMYVNPVTGAVVLIGAAQSSNIQAPLLIEDVGFCLYWLTSPNRWPFGCAFDQPAKHSHERSLSVRYFGGVENTHVGLALFQADLALKEYTLGRRTDGTQIQSSVDAYPAMLRLLETRTADSNIVAARFWFKTNPRLQVSGDGTLAIVKTPGISVAYMAQEWQEGEFIPSSKSTEPYRTFSNLFSEHFERFANEEPSFSWLARMSSIVALAGWMPELGKIGRIAWVNPIAHRKYRNPTSTPMITSRLERKETLRSGGVLNSVITLSGGISLGTGLAVINRGDDEMTRSIQAVLPRELDQAQVGTTLEINTPGQKYLGIVLCFTMP